MPFRNIQEILKTQELLNRHMWAGSVLKDYSSAVAAAAAYSNQDNHFSKISKAIAPYLTEIKKPNPLFNSSIADLINNYSKTNLALTSAADIVMNRSRAFIPLTTTSAIQKMFSGPKMSRTISVNQAVFDSLAKTINNQANISSALFKLDKISDYSKRFASIQSALGSVSSVIGYKGIMGDNFDFLKSFEAVTEKAAAAVTEVSNKEYATAEDIKKIEEFFKEATARLEEKIDKLSKSPLAIISLWVTILSILLTIYLSIPQLHESAVTTEKPASEEQIIQLQNFLTLKFDSALKSATKSGIIKIKCPLRIKPKIKSYCLYVLKRNSEINILEVNHKWVKVVFIDPTDNLPITGWILKKYLS